MAEQINDGGSAFPKSAFYAPGTVEDGLYNGPDDGMTLRQWYAGLAMQGLIASASPNERSDEYFVNRAARMAYELADMMIAKGKKP